MAALLDKALRKLLKATDQSTLDHLAETIAPSSAIQLGLEAILQRRSELEMKAGNANATKAIDRLIAVSRLALKATASEKRRASWLEANYELVYDVERALGFDDC
ncbi:MAG: hypothetical protein H0X45_01870 [Planctomycetes bacterium]|nr:hypothetical protein [Planctomycetota bacterium]